MTWAYVWTAGVATWFEGSGTIWSCAWNGVGVRAAGGAVCGCSVGYGTVARGWSRQCCGHHVTVTEGARPGLGPDAGLGQPQPEVGEGIGEASRGAARKVAAPRGKVAGVRRGEQGDWSRGVSRGAVCHVARFARRGGGGGPRSGRTESARCAVWLRSGGGRVRGRRRAGCARQRDGGPRRPRGYAGCVTAGWARMDWVAGGSQTERNFAVRVLGSAELGCGKRCIGALAEVAWARCACGCACRGDTVAPGSVACTFVIQWPLVIALKDREVRRSVGGARRPWAGRG